MLPTLHTAWPADERWESPWEEIQDALIDHDDYEDHRSDGPGIDDYDGGFGPGSYFARAMAKDD